MNLIKKSKIIPLLIIAIFLASFNNTNDHENVKILVAFHKKYQLPKESYYIPIHAGRSIAKATSKDGQLANDQFKWLLRNMIGDNTGDNISKLNRSFNELTLIYWAWKNYKLIGSPEYIGLSHYRRLIKPDDGINNFDMYIGKSTNLKQNQTNYTQYINSKGHEKEDLDLAIKILKKDYPEYTLSADEYLKDNKAYFCNLFIMKHNVFFEYSQWLFSILFKVHEQLDYSKYKNDYAKRVIGFLSERLTGIFIYHKNQLGYKIKEVSADFILDS